MGINLLPWVILFCWALLLVGAFETVRRTFVRGLTREVLVSYVAFTLLLISMSLGLRLMALKIDALVSTSADQSPVNILEGQAKSATETAEMAYRLARSAFVASGTLLQYRSNDGLTTRFAPDRDAINEREERVTAVAHIRARAQGLRNQSIQVLATTFFAVLLAIVLGVVEKRRREQWTPLVPSPTNSSTEKKPTSPRP